MAFTAITTGEIASGEPNKNSTWTKVKDNFDDLDSRLTALDLNAAEPPIIFRVNGVASSLTLPFTAFLKTTMNFNLRVTGAYVLIDTAGASGTTEIDLKFKRGAGSYTSIFTTKPSVAYTAGNDAISSNGVINSTYQDLEAGDILALDITSAQSNGTNFLVRVDYTKI